MADAAADKRENHLASVGWKPMALCGMVSPIDVID